MEAVEQRKQRDFNRKYQKQFSDRQKQKKQEDKVSELGKRHRDSSSNNDDEDDNGPRKSKKRMVMDRKYGMGGKDRKRARKNDAK